MTGTGSDLAVLEEREGRMGGRSDLELLRGKVLAEVALVGLVTLALEVANVRWDLLAGLTRHSALAAHVLWVLAVSHLLMLVFGARRGRELAAAYAQRQQAQEQLRHQATHDPVTGLLTHPSLHEAAAGALARGPAGLVRLRLLGLEEIAATLGHDVRDELLAAAARRLEQEARSPGGHRHAVVASVQGDEFAVLLPDVDQAGAQVHAVRLLACLQGPLPVGSAQLEAQACAGLAVGHGAGAGTGTPIEAGELLGRAAVALQAATPGTPDVPVYRPELDRRDARRLGLHAELRRGIATGQLRLHHQLKVTLETGVVSGVEALVRWQHPTRGLLPPAAFLDLAEQTGLVGELTAAVLDQALHDHVAWARQGRVLPVAVNLSRRCLSDPTLPQRVADALARHRVDAGQLELEVTESAAVQDPHQACVVLGALRALGVGVSLDDYGTGQSFLTSLSQLPLTALKIDRSFVQAMHSSSRDLTIVRSTVDLAHGLGHLVIAEGVESHSAWRWLQTLGCDQAQGFWLARPLPAQDVLTCVREVEQRLAGLAAGPVLSELA